MTSLPPMCPRGCVDSFLDASSCRSEQLHQLHLCDEAVSYSEAVKSTLFTIKPPKQVCSSAGSSCSFFMLFRGSSVKVTKMTARQLLRARMNARGRQAKVWLNRKSIAFRRANQTETRIVCRTLWTMARLQVRLARWCVDLIFIYFEYQME
jgi:hypothetical protein